MQKKEVHELRRRLTKTGVTFTRLCGCYVDSSKQKVLTFNKNFLNLPDDEFYKYIDIAKKTLSGNVGNNLIELEFPLCEEIDAGKQKGLLALRDSALKEDSIIESFYDLVIENYECSSNYLILLYHDCYDIPMKATDETKIGESDEVFSYIMCAICPVELSKPALGYNDTENDISARVRDWIVGMPESGFTYPCFTDRSTDIHSVMVYTKNPKAPHRELWNDILGCDSDNLTAEEKKQAFFEIIEKNSPDSDTETKLAKVKVSIASYVDSKEEDHSHKRLCKEDATEILIEAGIEEMEAANIARQCLDTLGEQMPLATELLSSSDLKKAEAVVEKQRIVKENLELKSMMHDAKPCDDRIRISIPENRASNIQIKDDDGNCYLIIPVTTNDQIMVNGQIRK